MAYTVKKLAELSGVSVRTLHHYDAIDLLKPAYCGANGYRYYEEEQLLRLQQILFFRELGMELKQIGKILDRSDFSRMGALTSHRKVLQREVKRLQGLIKTIDNTVKHLNGDMLMEPQEFFPYFHKKKQREYEKYIAHRYGETATALTEESKHKTAKWTEADGARAKAAMEELNRAFAQAIDAGHAHDSDEVQALVAHHCEWIRQFYTPTKEVYIGLGRLYNDNEDFRLYYESFHQELAPFLEKAMAAYAERHLS